MQMEQVPNIFSQMVMNPTVESVKKSPQQNKSKMMWNFMEVFWGGIEGIDILECHFRHYILKDYIFGQWGLIYLF